MRGQEVEASPDFALPMQRRNGDTPLVALLGIEPFELKGVRKNSTSSIYSPPFSQPWPGKPAGGYLRIVEIVLAETGPELRLLNPQDEKVGNGPQDNQVEEDGEGIKVKRFSENSG